MAVQAKRAGLPSLERTRVVLSIHGTDEIHRVLNGQSLTEPEAAGLTACERLALAGAHMVFTPLGDVQDTYERYYGAEELAPFRAVTHPFLGGGGRALPVPRRGRRRPARLIHIGRYERRKGVAELIAAVRSVDRDDVRLTLQGRDTPTGPGWGLDARVLRAAGGGRSAHRAARPDRSRRRDRSALADHDVTVIPSRWETNADTARESLAVGRPVLATPTGGLVQMVEHGHNGWLTDGTDQLQIARGDRAPARRSRRGAPRDDVRRADGEPWPVRAQRRGARGVSRGGGARRDGNRGASARSRCPCSGPTVRRATRRSPRFAPRRSRQDDDGDAVATCRPARCSRQRSSRHAAARSRPRPAPPT